ncbi:hypothetical protein DFH08DRAFT_430677 [Mycena albidolilacea]|uniref:Uncharacterized protein n=1 Tax=Mycena albidolilacea TaxID=1033008 RepID=A0AAD7EDK0_9AGAR|nr:hypothetical protein DFH08DRAFT_430677 [Mycena albidolilacea]
MHTQDARTSKSQCAEACPVSWRYISYPTSGAGCVPVPSSLIPRRFVVPYPFPSGAYATHLRYTGAVDSPATLLVKMGHARLPFFYRLSLVFLSTQVVHSWAAPIPNYTFTLFGVPITIYTGNNGAGGANTITTSTSPIRTQATTTTTQRTAHGTTTTTTSTHTAPDSTLTAQQAPTTSAATPTTATPTAATPATASPTTVPQIVAAGSSAAAHLSDTTSEHNAPAASSITAASAVVPSLLTDLSTDAAGSAPDLSSMVSEPAAASPSSTDIISVSSSSNKSALVANILIPLIIFFVLLAAGLVHKRRCARAKKHAAEIDGHVVPYMLEFSSSDGDAWTRFDGTPPPAQLAAPERALGTSAAPVGAYSISSTAPTLSYSVPRTDDWRSALAHLTTNYRQSMVSGSALAYMTAGDRHSVVSDASYYQETSSGADVLRPSGDTRSSPSPVASDSDESRSMALSDAYSSRHLTADHPTPPPLYHYQLR